MSYVACADKHPDGWLCVKSIGHLGDHLSWDNRGTWKGTVGILILWANKNQPPVSDSPPPVRPPVHGLRVRSPAAMEYVRQAGFTGDICSICGSAQMKRSGACLVCMNCGSNTSCG